MPVTPSQLKNLHLKNWHLINADLHCHSKISDGTLQPEDVAARAKAGGVELWALTDHDEIRGIKRARAAAKSYGMDFLSGVEISVTFADQTVHIVGLGVDEDNEALVAGLAATRGGRLERAKEMSADLAKVGIKNALEGALKYVGNPDLISRSHFARYIVEIGVCQETNEVFRKYLTTGKPGFVEHRWAKLRDAVEWIVGAGGEAVIAHPARYGFSANVEYALFTDFKNFGGRGVEVVTGSHSLQDYATYAAMAKEFDLMASKGSDFHSPEESRCALGSLPNLSGELTPIWTVLEGRIS